MARVLDQVPCWLAWIPLSTLRFRRLLSVHQWHLWLPGDAAQWHRPDLLQPPNTRADIVVATWRGTDALAVRRAVLHALMVVGTIKESHELAASVTYCDAAEALRRKTELANVEDARALLGRRGFTGWQHDIAGACAKCGRPLRDPLSVARGIGPECWLTAESILDSLPYSVAALARTDVPATMWPGAQPLSLWRHQLVVRPRRAGRRAVFERSSRSG